jgi:hypothetical protein
LKHWKHSLRKLCWVTGPGTELGSDGPCCSPASITSDLRKCT